MSIENGGLAKIFGDPMPYEPVMIAPAPMTSWEKTTNLIRRIASHWGPEVGLLISTSREIRAAVEKMKSDPTGIHELTEAIRKITGNGEAAERHAIGISTAIQARDFETFEQRAGRMRAMDAENARRAAAATVVPMNVA